MHVLLTIIVYIPQQQVLKSSKQDMHQDHGMTAGYVWQLRSVKGNRQCWDYYANCEGQTHRPSDCVLMVPVQKVYCCQHHLLPNLLEPLQVLAQLCVQC